MDGFGFTWFLPPSGWRSRHIFFSGHGLYYKQFTKEGFPNHPEAFLRGILDYDEDLSEQILAFSTESSAESGFRRCDTREGTSGKRERERAASSGRTSEEQVASGQR
jgi:hypothetical protein